MVGRRQYRGFRDRVVKARFFRHFTRPTRRQTAYHGYDIKTARVPLMQLFDDNGKIIRGQLGLIDNSDNRQLSLIYPSIQPNARPVGANVVPTELDVAILPSDTYSPNVQDLSLNTYFEFVVYPKYTIGGLTETDIMQYDGIDDEKVELVLDRPINDPSGFQAFFMNTSSKPI